MNVLPLAFTGAFAAFMLLPRVQHNPRQLWSFASAAAALLLWNAVLYFAYAFDMLLAWSRRGINLFLWFRDDWILGRAGLPTFYDKLLQVPLLNLSIKLIDRLADGNPVRYLSPARLGATLVPRQRYLAYIGVWVVAFTAMTFANGVGDRHPGQWLPFWEQACQAERPWACDYLAQRESELCAEGSGWACNEFGLLQRERDVEGPGAASSFTRGCAIGFDAACVNASRARDRILRFVTTSPRLDDFEVVLRGSKGPIAGRTREALYAEACRQGWPGTCERTTVSESR